jgi:AAA+ superfamily predicted ATPase
MIFGFFKKIGDKIHDAVLEQDQKYINDYFTQTFLVPELPIPSAYRQAQKDGKVMKLSEAKALLKYNQQELHDIAVQNLDAMFESTTKSDVVIDHINKLRKAVAVNIGEKAKVLFSSVLDLGKYVSTNEFLQGESVNPISQLVAGQRTYVLPSNIKKEIADLYKLGLLNSDETQAYMKRCDEWAAKIRQVNDTKLKKDLERSVIEPVGPVSKKPEPQTTGLGFKKAEVDEESGVTSSYMQKADAFLKKKKVPKFKKEPKLEDLIGMTDKKAAYLMGPFIAKEYAEPGEVVSSQPVVILGGLPGTGKSRTMMAIANEKGFYMQVVDAASYKNMYVGETEKNFKKLIESAIKKADETKKPSLIMIDEAEVMFPRKDSSAHDVDKTVMSMFNSYTSGPLKKDIDGKVFFLLTINNMEAIDPSVISRAEILEFDKPPVKDLEKILIQQTVGRYMKVDFEKIDWHALAKEADGLVPRDIEQVGRDAKNDALAREAERLGTKLHTASEKEIESIKKSYMIKKEDILKEIRHKTGRKFPAKG